MKFTLKIPAIIIEANNEEDALDELDQRIEGALSDAKLIKVQEPVERTYTYDGDNYKDFLNALTPEAKLLFNKFIEKYDDDTWSADALKNWQSIFAPYGITFDYGLSLEPYDITLTIK